MAFQCFLDMFNIGTGSTSSTVVRTGYGFQPKACLYWWSGRTESAATFARASLMPGFGMASSPTARACVTAYSTDAAATMITNRYHTNVNVIAETISPAGADQVAGLADLQSFDAGGQTLVITDTFLAQTNLRVHCLALGGSDLTDAAVVQFQAPGTTGAQTQDITTVGFQPDAVLFMSLGYATVPAAITPTAELTLGVATGASTQGVVTFADIDAGGSSDTYRYGYGGECLSGLSAGTTITWRAALDSFLSNGFRLSWLEKTSASAHYCWALCLKGGSYLVGNLVTSTTLSATMVESDFGFAPRGCLLMSHSDIQSTQDTQVAQANLSLGGFTSTTTRACQSIVSNDAANAAICGSSINEDACLRMLNNGTTSAGVVDVSAVGSDGFTLIMDAADVTTAKYATFLAFGDAPPAAGARTPPSTVAAQETSFGATTATTRVTGTMNVLAGDVLVALVLCDLASAIGTLTVSGGTLAWTTRQDVGTTTQARAVLATAVVDTNKSMTVTATRSLTTSTSFGMYVFVTRGVSGLGIDVGQAVSVTGVPSLALTTRAANSLLILGIVDQNAVVTYPTWLAEAGAFTDMAVASPSAMSIYVGWHANTGATATYTVGESAPTGQMWAMAALELYGPLTAGTKAPPPRRQPLRFVRRAA